MKANENNFIDLIKKQKEEGILYVIETYGGLLHSIVRKRLFNAPDRIEECMNDIISIFSWASGRISTAMMRQKGALRAGRPE